MGEEAMTREQELESLLREARARLWLHMETYFAQQGGTMFSTFEFIQKIDRFFAKGDPDLMPAPITLEMAQKHPAWCFIYDGRICSCGVDNTGGK